jgi:hypothetical protein
VNSLLAAVLLTARTRSVAVDALSFEMPKARTGSVAVDPLSFEMPV